MTAATPGTQTACNVAGWGCPIRASRAPAAACKHVTVIPYSSFAGGKLWADEGNKHAVSKFVARQHIAMSSNSISTMLQCQLRKLRTTTHSQPQAKTRRWLTRCRKVQQNKNGLVCVCACRYKEVVLKLKLYKFCCVCIRWK